MNHILEKYIKFINEKYLFKNDIYINYNSNEEVIYKSIYGNETFIVGVKKDNIIGLQFHPERSGFEGMQLLTKIILDQCENFNVRNNY